jgi:nucleoid-associated protein YgaU
LTDEHVFGTFYEHMFAKIVIRTLVVTGVALLAWSVLARPSGAHSPRTTYRVRAGDTLWSIAASHEGGDLGLAVWRIEQANHLAGAAIFPGERLELP